MSLPESVGTAFPSLWPCRAGVVGGVGVSHAVGVLRNQPMSPVRVGVGCLVGPAPFFRLVLVGGVGGLFGFCIVDASVFVVYVLWFFAVFV